MLTMALTCCQLHYVCVCSLDHTCVHACISGFVGHMLCTTSMVHVVHHQPALCNMVHKGDLIFFKGVNLNIFHCLVVQLEHAENGHFLSIYKSFTAETSCPPGNA